MTASTTARQVTIRRAEMLVVGAGVLIGVLGAALALSWLPTLPDPAANQFAVDGRPEGFTPRGIWAGTAAALLVGLPVLFGGASLASARGYSASLRVLTAMVPAVASFLTVIILASMWVQRGLADAREAQFPVLNVVWAVLATLVAFALAWLVLPTPLASDEEVAALPSRELRLRETEAVSWSRTVRVGLLPALGMVGGLVAMVAAALNGTPGLWLGVAVVALAALSLSAYRISADQRGLTWRSVLGVPRGQVPLADIASVRAVEVEPMTYGGWGLRVMPGHGVGLIIRRGPGIEVTRRDGRRLTVTVDDAQTGAGVLAALVRRTGAREATRGR